MEIAERAPARAGADAAGACGAARLRQALAQSASCWTRTCRTIPISAASSAAISRQPIVEQFPDALEHHRLRREIIATQLANSMINRGGPSFVVRIADQTGARAGEHRGRLCRGARQLRHDRAQQRDRRARQQDSRQAAARALRRGAGPAARSRGLVPAQCRSRRRARRDRRALSRRHRGGRRPRSTARCRRAAGGAAGARKPS